MNPPTLADAKGAICLLEAMSRAERSLLLYLETCAVDKGGIVAACHMNAEDFATARAWHKTGFLRFSRIPTELRDVLPAAYAVANHVVEFNYSSFVCAHVERLRRAQRSQADVVQASLAYFEQRTH
jgi:hypothetical protein